MDGIWRKFSPFMSDDAIKYMSQKDAIYSEINRERDREQLIKDILDRIDIKIENLASKPLAELEASMNRIFSK